VDNDPGALTSLVRGINTVIGRGTSEAAREDYKLMEKLMLRM
jgi:hypothetical protein